MHIRLAGTSRRITGIPFSDFLLAADMSIFSVIRCSYKYGTFPPHLCIVTLGAKGSRCVDMSFSSLHELAHLPSVWSSCPDYDTILVSLTHCLGQILHSNDDVLEAHSMFRGSTQFKQTYHYILFVFSPGSWSRCDSATTFGCRHEPPIFTCRTSDF